MARVRFCVAPDPECDGTQVAADPGAEWMEPFSHGIGRTSSQPRGPGSKPMIYRGPQMQDTALKPLPTTNRVCYDPLRWLTWPTIVIARFFTWSSAAEPCISTPPFRSRPTAICCGQPPKVPISTFTFVVLGRS